jgi:hypothetical protein
MKSLAQDRSNACLFLLLLSLACGSPPILQAELPTARLSTVFPPGGRLGSSVEVSVTGADLDQARELRFSYPVIAGQKLNPAGTEKFTINIASNVPPGIYECRLIGQFGISNPRSFEVGDRPEMVESATNNSRSSAMQVPLGTVINAHADRDNADYFNFVAHKGQRILIDCETQKIDSRMDPTLVLFNAAGRELQRNRNGTELDFAAPEDAQYTLKVYDFLSQGGPEYFYRLKIGTGPHIDYIFPPSGAPGTKSNYFLYGRNLPGSIPAHERSVDGKPLEQLSVEIELPGDPLSQQRLSTSLPVKPMEAMLDGVEYRLPSEEGISNPVLLTFATAPIVRESEPNDNPAKAQKVSVPCEYVGQFYPRGDRDWLSFEAKKGEIYWIEVFSNRLGLPTDPFFLLQLVKKNDKGQEEITDLQEVYDTDTNIGGVEFKTATRDPASRFEVKEDGVYRIQVRDLFNQSRDDPSLVYRLSIRTEKPDFRLVALAQAPPPTVKDSKELIAWTPLLRKGGTLPIKVLAFRRDGFNGDIRLAVEGLPKGITCADAKIAANNSSATLMLVASENGEGWAGSIAIIGRAEIGGSAVTREARGGMITWPVNDYTVQPVFSRMTRDFAIALSAREASPISIDQVEDKSWETSVAGKLQIPIKLTTRGEFKSNLKLKVAGVPALDAMKEFDFDAKATNGMLELDFSPHKLPAGDYVIYLQTQTPGKYIKDPDAAKAAEQAAKEADRIATESAEAAKTALSGKQAAQKAAADAEATLKQASQALSSASKLAEEAEAQTKACVEKLSLAKAAAEKTLASQETAATVAAAEKEAAEATEKSRLALDAKIAAEKKAAELSAQEKVAKEASDAAAKTESEATAKAQNAAKAKEEAANRVKETAQKDVTATFYSPPISLKISPAPITLAAARSSLPLRQGGKIEIRVTITRLYGYADPVELNLVLPAEIKGLSAPKVAIPKNQTESTLVIDAAPDATLGEHKLTLNASLKLNNQELKVDQTVLVAVAPRAGTKAE